MENTIEKIQEKTVLELCHLGKQAAESSENHHSQNEKFHDILYRQAKSFCVDIGIFEHWQVIALDKIITDMWRGHSAVQLADCIINSIIPVSSDFLE